ncbi:DUF2147 domain-containing protein [Pseudooceanicola lipolyticus]|uniref:DUF2147 domain-containing protein n=1 Tax=Pseudooceanicola lipolyticus TaxID=2029104 RepID=A0A2M8J5Z8_9RHOB|nr:DUF2147 domain-containing protein [Pseudooceanicola lipolyticus]PJE38209.1 DUF2147 domain-containing protein [Pseudooceanicola lipolyticus]
MKSAFFGLTLAAALGGAALADPVDGTWKTAEGETGGYLHVTIGPCGAAICGTIAQAFDASGAASADYAHLGKKLIWDMTAEGGGAYSGGTIWAPDTDKTYRSKMALSGDALEVKGCVAGGLICRGQTWTRIK